MARKNGVALDHDHVAPVYAELRAMLPEGSSFGLALHPRDLKLDLICVAEDQRGQGHGERVLTRLCQIADKNKWTLTLRIGSVGGDPARLSTWYGRHGFIGAGRKKIHSSR